MTQKRCVFVVVVILFFANLKNSVNLNSASKCCWKSKLWTPIARLVCCVGASSICIILVTPSQQNQTVSLNSHQLASHSAYLPTHTNIHVMDVYDEKRMSVMSCQTYTLSFFRQARGYSWCCVTPGFFLSKTEILCCSVL